MKTNFILFDFDGVIINSFASAFEVNKMICPHITEDDYRRRFDGNINDADNILSYHTENCRHDIDFFKEYIPRMKKETGVISGMAEVIKQLAEKYALIIISSTITSPIQEFMKDHGLDKYFIEIMGNDVHTSKVEKIKMVFLKYKTSSEKCIFITDTLGDMREANEAGVGAIGVVWGFQKPETLLRGSPFRIVQGPEELPVAVSDYFSKNLK